jgi:hypothetical protein
MIGKITIETDFVSLTEILNKTGNPKLAVQILEGTYQEPVIDTRDRASTPLREDAPSKQCVFISYDKWRDEVKYREVGRYEQEIKRKDWEKLELWEVDEPDELTYFDGDETDKITY